MTEAEWFAVTDWHQHLHFLGDRASPRKRRLLAAGFCRLAWHLFDDDPECQLAIDLAELSAEGRASVADLERSRKQCRNIATRAQSRSWEGSREQRLSQAIRCEVAWASALVVGGQLDVTGVSERILQAVTFAETGSSEPQSWLRAEQETQRRIREQLAGPQRRLLFELFGNPFSAVAFEPEWRTSTVRALASPMLESGDFRALPILADALEDAGCENDAVLSHCRCVGPHFRGCWVVDGLLGQS